MLTDLLKEGHKHLTEVALQNIDSVKNLAEITRTSLGPRGMNKMIINHLEKLFVTNDAATIIKELDVIHPAAKMAVLASQAQEQEIGDGTNFVIVFIGSLLENAESLLRKGLHPSEIIDGYSKAVQKSFEILEELKVFQLENIRNVDEVTKCLKSVISAKQYGYEDLLTPMIAQACINVLPKNPKNFNVDNVRVAKILGGGVLDTQVVKGHVLTRDTEGTIKHFNNAKIAVFAGGIELPKTETKDTVLITSAEQLMNYSKSEERAMEEIIRKISEAGVNVIISGGAVSEMALHFIERYKMMIVKVQSKFELRRICKTVGATALVRLGTPIPEELGLCDVVTVEEIGSTKVTIFRQEKENSEISTIVVRASTENILNDIERSIDDGVNIFKAITKDNRFVAGGGATEIELSKRIQNFGEATPGLIQYAIKKYGESFEVIPRTIAENAGLKSTDILSNLYAEHQKGNIYDGINVEDGTITNMVQLGILDHLFTKYNAIRLATDTAITILKIDQIIMSKPSGGPKPPKQGPMDEE
jgi:T-complex protein 1 subunit theta